MPRYLLTLDPHFQGIVTNESNVCIHFLSHRRRGKYQISEYENNIMFVFNLTRSKAALRETSARSWVFCRAIEIFRDRDSTGTTGTFLSPDLLLYLIVVFPEFSEARGYLLTLTRLAQCGGGMTWCISGQCLGFILISRICFSSGPTLAARKVLSSAGRQRPWPGWRTGWSARTSPTSGPPLPVLG